MHLLSFIQSFCAPLCLNFFLRCSFSLHCAAEHALYTALQSMPRAAVLQTTLASLPVMHSTASRHALSSHFMSGSLLWSRTQSLYTPSRLLLQGALPPTNFIMHGIPIWSRTQSLYTCSSLLLQSALSATDFMTLWTALPIAHSATSRLSAGGQCRQLQLNRAELSATQVGSLQVSNAAGLDFISRRVVVIAKELAARKAPGTAWRASGPVYTLANFVPGTFKLCAFDHRQSILELFCQALVSGHSF